MTAVECDGGMPCKFRGKDGNCSLEKIEIVVDIGCINYTEKDGEEKE